MGSFGSRDEHVACGTLMSRITLDGTGQTPAWFSVALQALGMAGVRGGIGAANVRLYAVRRAISRDIGFVIRR
jgi:hypothetical protein